MTHQINDPGYGTKTSRGRGRILRRDGTLNVKRKGVNFRIKDLYHIALDTTWSRFILGAMCFYICANVAFALVYLLLGPENIQGTRDGSWWTEFQDCFFFSAQTLTTVGYGTLSPIAPIISFIAAIEAMLGLLMFGVFTGMAFGRFSRIRPRIKFTKNALIAPYREPQNAVMVRLVNERGGQIMDARVTMMLVKEFQEEGRLKRQFFDLSLEISHIKSLALSWTIVHPLTEDSPLVLLREEELKRVNAELIVILQAFDDTVGQPFYARGSYKATDFLVGYKFDPMFHDNNNGVVELDIDKLDSVHEADLFDQPYLDDTDRTS